MDRMLYTFVDIYGSKGRPLSTNEGKNAVLYIANILKGLTIKTPQQHTLICRCLQQLGEGGGVVQDSRMYLQIVDVITPSVRPSKTIIYLHYTRQGVRGVATLIR